MIKLFHKKEVDNFRASHIFVGLFIVASFASFGLSMKLSSVAEQIYSQNLLSKAPNIGYISMSQNLSTPAKIEITPTPNLVVTKTPEVWGVATQLDEKTWTIKVKNDDMMATGREVFEALNLYRKRNGVSELTWDDKLAEFSDRRAEVFASTGGLDGHRGFQTYFNNEQNLKNIGFLSVGENSSHGYKLIGVHLIEWIFAADEPHNKNQLDRDWTHVGIGVEGTGVNIVFGKNKI